jgi:starch phosphorylase
MPTLHRYEVLPSIPEPLRPLLAIAKNLWWSWNEGAKELFSGIDPALYERVAQNPLMVLTLASQERLDELSRDGAYLEAVSRVRAELDDYLRRPTWFERTHGGTPLAGARIGYFSMEFGIHECAARLLGRPRRARRRSPEERERSRRPARGRGRGLLEGYFRQSLDPEGWQHERYPHNDWHDLPVTAVTSEDGARASGRSKCPPLPVPSDGPATTRAVTLGPGASTWAACLSSCSTRTSPRTRPADRALTNTLYGGDRNHRIRQEILLGVGGVRLLGAARPPADGLPHERRALGLPRHRARPLS